MDYFSDRQSTQLWHGVLTVADACLLATDAPDDTKNGLARVAVEIVDKAQKWHEAYYGDSKRWLRNLKATPIVDAPCRHAPEDPEKILKGVYMVLMAHLGAGGGAWWEWDWENDTGLGPMESLQLFGLCNERPNLENFYTFCQVFAGIDKQGLNDMIHMFCPTLLQIHVETPVRRKRRWIETNVQHSTPPPLDPRLENWGPMSGIRRRRGY